ncbi:MAG TPA: haloacid dehalogenase type II [Candidatus Angelobacter sp.]|nr:haloacid dehalogenase type II [Candidatus Angelobacter sp.]
MFSPQDFSSIRLITFDCYGTLIDWETGMLAALRPMFSRDGRTVPDAQLLEQYGEAEVELEAGEYLPYRQVLARSVETMGRRLNVAISSEDGRRFAESLTQWEPFSDTVGALQVLAKRFRLGVISNVDDDLFAATKKKLGVEFSVIVTAQQVRSYKPSLANFEEAVRRSGLKKEEILHAAQSMYHDVIPANALGIKNVWVDRPSARPGSGATRPAVAQPTAKVNSLAELVKLLTRSTRSTKPYH